MTMSAAASASAIVAVAIASAAVATASTTTTGEHVDHALNLFVGGRTILYDFAYEGEVFACQAVVEVDDDFSLLHLENQTLEMVAVFVHQGDVGAGIDVL